MSFKKTIKNIFNLFKDKDFLSLHTPFISRKPEQQRSEDLY